jgi:queuosine precursor transporter
LRQFHSYKLYSTLCTLFVVLITIGNLIYKKFVFLPLFSFYTFEISVGAVLYPLTFLITDLIVEFYGKSKAEFCVTLAIFANILTLLIIMFTNQLNATTWSTIDNSTFNKVFGLYGVSFFSSIIACYISQIIDIRIYLWIKKVTNEKFLWLRNNVSTSFSLFIDTFIVVGILAIFGVLPFDKITVLIINSYIYKLFFTICSTPIFCFSVMVIKRMNIKKISVSVLNRNIC